MQQSLWPDWLQKDITENDLPFAYKSLESQKMMMLYFLVGTLKSLKTVNFDRERILKWINETIIDQNGKIIGFASTPYFKSEAHLVHSFCAIAICNMLNEKKIIEQLKQNSDLIIEWIYSLQNPDGSIRACEIVQECDLRMIYSALEVLEQLDLIRLCKQEFKDKVVQFILRCQNPDGAFGLLPGLESHGGATFCGIVSLRLLGINIPFQTSLIEWLIQRQYFYDSGEMNGIKRSGFQGRVGKVPDSCYSFWCGWSLQILGYSDLIDFESLKEFLQSCQSSKGLNQIYLSFKVRGFSKYPQGHPDPIHTMHSILGIMLQNQKEKLDFLHAIPLE